MSAAFAAQGARTPTRELILDEFERLIVEKGVYGFTLRDVAEPLGVQAPAIYKHFESRDDVLVEVSRRFIALLAGQFRVDPALRPAAALRRALDAFVEFKMLHPAYVRLALGDFATPGGGMEYVKIAAGGSFQENFSAGPLAAMHARLRRLLRAGARVPRGRCDRLLSDRQVGPADPARVPGRRAAAAPADAGTAEGGAALAVGRGESLPCAARATGSPRTAGVPPALAESTVIRCSRPQGARQGPGRAAGHPHDQLSERALPVQGGQGTGQ